MFVPSTSPRFVHFGEVYVTENTMMQDLGRYEVSLTTVPDSGQGAPEILQIPVISPGTEDFSLLPHAIQHSVDYSYSWGQYQCEQWN